VPAGMRTTTRLRTALAVAVEDGRDQSEVAAAHGVSWPTVARRCPTHLLEYPHWASFHIPEVASATYLYRRRVWHRYRASFRWMVICIIWRLGYQAIQLFTISRGSRSAPPHTPEHDRCFPGHAIVPGLLSDSR
jgi:hypothetical protein